MMSVLALPIQFRQKLLATSLLSITLALGACSSDDDSSDTQDSLLESQSVSYDASAPIFPEGLVYDASRGVFLVSSASSGAVGQVDATGTYTSMISPTQFAGNGSFGMAVDEVNDRLHVAVANIQNPAVARLMTFNRSSFELLHDNDFAAISGSPSFANDVTVDADGNAYVTNSKQGVIYRVNLSGEASVYYEDASLSVSTAEENGLNGIAFNSEGFLVLAHSETSAIFKLSLGDFPVLNEISLPDGIVDSPDGIAISGDYLYTVNAGSMAGYVAQFAMSDEWSSGTLEGDTFATGSIFPTTLASNGEDLFVNNSYFSFPAFGNNPTEYLLSQVQFDQSVRYSGSASEIPRINTPISPFGYGDSTPAPLLEGCDEPLAANAPDLRGDWVESDVVIDGETLSAATEDSYAERIEQCGDRLIVVSNGVIHDIYKADGTMFNGVNDVNPRGMPIHSSGEFVGNGLVLTPIFPVESGVSVENVTRELITDDAGDTVLRFFNPVLGRVIYLTRDQDDGATI